MIIDVTEIEAVWERTTATVEIDDDELESKYFGDVYAWLDDNMDEWYGDAYHDFIGSVDSLDRELTYKVVRS